MNVHEERLKRARDMLRIAARFIREHGADYSINYDGADCGGDCLAEDCETAADLISPLQPVT